MTARRVWAWAVGATFVAGTPGWGAAGDDEAKSRPPGRAAAEPGGSVPPSRIEALRRERLQVLRSFADQVRAGGASGVDVHRAELEQLGAELDLARSPADRVAVRERAVKVAKDLEDTIAALTKRGAKAQADLVRARVDRLGAEIGLEQERAAAAGGDRRGPAAKPRWEGSVRTTGDKTKAELAALATTSLADAEKSAREAVPGDDPSKIVWAELKVGHGFLVYQVEVVTPEGGGVRVVVVDAGTGKVLAVEPAGLEGDRRPGR